MSDKIISRDLTGIPEIEILPTADTHIGDLLSQEKQFIDFLSGYVLAKEHRYLLLVGDLINNNLRYSVGSPYDDFLSPSQQKKKVRELLLPVAEAGRIIAATGGNHEGRTKQTADVDITEDICEFLGIPYAEDDGIVHLQTDAGDYTIFFTHGSSGGKKPGAALNNLEALSLNVQADIYVIGHSHRKIAHKAQVRVPNLETGREEMKEQLYVVTGSWVLYGGYAKRKQYRPQAIGCTKIIIDGKTRNFYGIV